VEQQTQVAAVVVVLAALQLMVEMAVMVL